MEWKYITLDSVDIVDEYLHSRFNELFSQLVGKDMNVTVDELEDVRKRKESELLLFMYDDAGVIVGMAQISYHCTPPKYVGYLNTVVVDSAYRGQGLGTHLLKEIERKAYERWPKITAFQLTSAPQKGAQGFYLKLGYRMRTKEEGDETIFYTKDAQ
jgi:GNAT superfamily N-acetyltransferase